MRLLTQSAFVDEDERTAFVLGFFLMRVQVLRFQVRICSSLRSRAFPTGRCGLQSSARRIFTDVAFVVVDPELVSDQPSHPRTAPQGRGEAVGLRAFQQQRRQAFALCGIEERLASGAPGLAESGRTLLAVLTAATH